ncbi:hypothetical protein Fot_08630 [Forsythia ovata]|uniref:Gag1-like clamp domain-containing protein n=1 Tax=Forsythia ovata TaxID=205694 RepID=A0ABD1WZ62_9LAMI
MKKGRRKVYYLIVNRLPEGQTKERERIANSFLSQSSGYLGCHTNCKLTSSLEEPLKGKNPHAWKASKAGTSEDFWTTSTCEMEDNKVQSEGSIFPVSTLTQMHDAPGAGCSNNPSDFINHGLLLWYQIREKWIENKKPVNHSQQPREPRISWNATYDSLLGSNKRFSKPVPLGEMVDFLVDIWEQEGMYD